LQFEIKENWTLVMVYLIAPVKGVEVVKIEDTIQFIAKGGKSLTNVAT
jgi:hypothetical protein